METTPAVVETSDSEEIPSSSASVSQFLRIQATNSGLAQMQYTPDSTSNPDYGYILNFSSAVLADSNDNPLKKSDIIVRIQQTAVTMYHLPMLARLLQPFSGYFELDVFGTYTDAGSYAEVYADAILGCDIQPV